MYIKSVRGAGGRLFHTKKMRPSMAHYIEAGFAIMFWYGASFFSLFNKFRLGDFRGDGFSFSSWLSLGDLFYHR